MTVFKTFLKVLNKNKFTLILYTIILIVFAGFNMTSSEKDSSFIASTPNILIINNDTEEGITKDLINYLTKNSKIVEIENNEEKIDDALFYRDVSYIIYIPKNFRNDFLQNKNPEIKVKTTGDYSASLINILLERYLNTASIYNTTGISETELITKINESLDELVEVELKTKLDTNKLSKVAYYYNFTNYCFLASSIFLICLVLSSFHSKMVQKRTIVSSTNYQKLNKELLLSNSLFVIALWLLYYLLSVILIGNIMFTLHGLLYMLNSFIFIFCTLTIAFLISNLINNKEAINGIVNVIALGSSFLCGAFVPMEYLPASVLKFAKILPSYWYISNNNFIKTIETFNIETLKPFVFNIIVIILFSLLFIFINNIISRYKEKIN